MRHIKLFEDYSDEDLKGLIGDLGDIGLADKVLVKFGVKIPIPQEQAHPSWWSERWAKFAIVEIYGSEVKAKNEDLAFEKIKKGDFTQDMSVINDWDKPLIEGVLEFLTPENIQKEAQESRDLNDFKTRIYTRTKDLLFKDWERMIEKHLEARSKEEEEAFFSPQWKSTPKAAKEEISGFIEIKVLQERIK